MKNKKKMNTAGKLPLYILATCFFGFFLMGIISYIAVNDMMTNQCKQNAMSYAEFAASELDGDRLAAISSEEDEGFSEIYVILSKYKKSELIGYIYTMRMDNGKLIFVVDADENDPAPCGEEYPIEESMLPAFNGEVCCDKEMTTDKWGSYLSAYAPVFTSDNRVAGIVGCDIRIEDVNKIRTDLRNIIITILSVFFLGYFLLYNRLTAAVVNRDLLTDLINYDGLVSKCFKLEEKRRLSDFTAVLINIKDFKYINQKIGANSGDIVLREYAAMLKKAVSGREFVARTGSDNFMALVLKCNESSFIERLSDVRLALNVNAPDELTSVFVRCGIYPIQPGDTIREVMNSASMALKESRRSDSSDFVRFESEMVKTMIEEKKLLADYKTAIQNREFAVYYQPKVNIENYTLCGAEALVRWIKKDRIIPPNVFIPVLEKESKIAELDFYVFETVCSNICDWVSKGIEPCRISSNFSKLHLANPHFAEDIISIIRKYNVDPKYIEIELTESSGYSDFKALTHFVDCMNRASVHTSIDDFGTGYSSLSMLKDINVDVVKIDKSFLAKTCSEDVQQEKMLKNVINMINDLDRTVICEGVESLDQLIFLKKANCSIIQGYFFDKPLPHDDFEMRLISPVYEMKPVNV